MDDFIRKIQLTEYEILKELDRIARKHNIRYYLGQGTLLGAAKYQKFIPWDDDIDLLIPYKDLKKLMKVFPQEADPKYILTNCYVEKHFPLPWSKIRNINTLSRPVRYKALPINWGVCIDLFSIYPISNLAFVRKIEYLIYKIAYKMLMAGFTKYEPGHGLFVRLLEKIPLCVRRLVLQLALALLTLHSEHTEYVMVACKGVKIVKRSMLFGDEKSLPFEDGLYPVIHDHEAYLTLNYGDWRADLPQDQKRGHDLQMGDIEWKL